MKEEAYHVVSRKSIVFRVAYLRDNLDRLLVIVYISLRLGSALRDALQLLKNKQLAQHNGRSSHTGSFLEASWSVCSLSSLSSLAVC